MDLFLSLINLNGNSSGEINNLCYESEHRQIPLTRKVFGFEQTYMHEILVTGGECRFSANLCKRAVDVTADVNEEATRNTDILTINANAVLMSS